MFVFCFFVLGACCYDWISRAEPSSTELTKVAEGGGGSTRGWEGVRYVRRDEGFASLEKTFGVIGSRVRLLIGPVEEKKLALPIFIVCDEYRY